MAAMNGGGIGSHSDATSSRWALLTAPMFIIGASAAAAAMQNGHESWQARGYIGASLPLPEADQVDAASPRHGTLWPWPRHLPCVPRMILAAAALGLGLINHTPYEQRIHQRL